MVHSGDSCACMIATPMSRLKPMTRGQYAAFSHDEVVAHVDTVTLRGVTNACVAVYSKGRLPESRAAPWSNV